MGFWSDLPAGTRITPSSAWTWTVGQAKQGYNSVVDFGVTYGEAAKSSGVAVWDATRSMWPGGSPADPGFFTGGRLCPPLALCFNLPHRKTNLFK